MMYGYARISRPTQNIERQIRNITEYEPTAKIFREAYTGTTQARPEWIKLMKRIRANDTIIFDSVSRMSRNAEEGFSDYQALFDKGVNLVFLKEMHINSAVYQNAVNSQIDYVGNEIADIYIEATNRVLMILARQQIELAFLQAEKEVTDLHHRTAEGIKTARQNGKQIGRPVGAVITTKLSIKAKAIIERHSIDFGGTLTDAEVMRMIGKISRNTYYKYKRELNNL